MRDCGDPSVPCHRVIAAGGRLGGYGGREAIKRRLLELEGCRVSGSRIVEFAERRWLGPRGRVERRRRFARL